MNEQALGRGQRSGVVGGEGGEIAPDRGKARVVPRHQCQGGELEKRSVQTAGGFGAAKEPAALKAFGHAEQIGGRRHAAFGQHPILKLLEQFVRAGDFRGDGFGGEHRENHRPRRVQHRAAVRMTLLHHAEEKRPRSEAGGGQFHPGDKGRLDGRARLFQRRLT